MYCYKCKKKLDLQNKIGFHEACPFCLVDLHVCKNCKFYQVGKPHDCNVPNIDLVLDKEKNNFCEEFYLKKDVDEDFYKNKKDISKKLFKDDLDDDPKSFDSLFDD